MRVRGRLEASVPPELNLDSAEAVSFLFEVCIANKWLKAAQIMSLRECGQLRDGCTTVGEVVEALRIRAQDVPDMAKKIRITRLSVLPDLYRIPLNKTHARELQLESSPHASRKRSNTTQNFHCPTEEDRAAEPDSCGEPVPFCMQRYLVPRGTFPEPQKNAVVLVIALLLVPEQLFRCPVSPDPKILSRNAHWWDCVVSFGSPEYAVPSNLLLVAFHIRLGLTIPKGYEEEKTIATAQKLREIVEFNFKMEGG
ncbi:hypothetical protein BKA70DRAFT_1218837 [Coprinopsis sp. MPI-PUGE-AT-0042]|nr:hypothetical protein BKA70DRAFT_1218837 [Coprinopsis sp. MPI-PUGE-AT-0042]